MMKRFLLPVLLFSSIWSIAQDVSIRKATIDKAPLEFAYFCESKDPKAILFALRNESSVEWNAITWTQQLYPLAEKNEWAVLSPVKQPQTAVEYQPWIKLMANYAKDSTSRNEVYFISYGDGARALPLLITAGWSGLIIEPGVLTNTGQPPLSTESCVALSARSENTVARALSDSLLRNGIWTSTNWHDESETYYVRDHYAVYDGLLNWVDSLRAILADSTRLADLRKQSGLTSTVPEVLKQGQRLPLDLLVIEATDIKLQVLDLSSKVVYEEVHFLGKGTHHLVLKTNDLAWGVYHVEIVGPGWRERRKIMIRG